LLAFGDVAVHMNDPADVVTKTGAIACEIISIFSAFAKLVYHRLRLPGLTD